MVSGIVNMKGVTSNDGDVKTGVGTMPHEVKRRLRKTMRGKSSGADDERSEAEGVTGAKAPKATSREGGGCSGEGWC